MASTFSDRLKLELMATGANANTWGTNTNNNLDVIDAFAAGYLSKSVAGSANITLTTANASDTAEASNKTIELTGALTGDIVVFIPAVESEYNFFNNTTGSQTLTIAATGHTANGVVIAQGAKTTVFCDGASNFNVEILSSTDAGALGSGTLPDARFPATLPAVSGANLTNLDAADLASGTIPDARFPATLPALNGSALTDLNASALASGTVNNARLDTVPTTKGGTGLTSIGTAGQIIQVNSGASALEFADASGGVSGSTTQTFNSPGNYTATSGTQMASITVAGGGGGGGGGSRALPFTPGSNGGSGGNSSFGSLLTANGGSGGQSAPHGGMANQQPGGSGGFGSTNAGAIIAKGDTGGSGTGTTPTNSPSPGGSGGSGLANGGAGGNGDSNGSGEGSASGAGGGGGGGVYGVLPPNQLSGTISITVGSGGNAGNKSPQFPGAQNGQAGQAGFVKVVDFT